MRHPRRAARVDKNQQGIVDALIAIPGVTVAVDHDDILVGYKKRTWWFEIKRPEVISKDGKVQNLKKSQQKLLDKWTGHYQVVSTIHEILDAIGINANDAIKSSSKKKWGYLDDGLKSY